MRDATHVMLLMTLRFYRQDDGQWRADLVIDVPAKKVDGWPLPEMNGKRQGAQNTLHEVAVVIIMGHAVA
jgi:hypothetical protein